VRLVDRVVEPEAVGDLLVGRVPEHELAPADHHRHIRDRDVKAIQQHLDVGLAIEVEILVRMAVAGQELLDAQRPGRM
jgi:hypothetical protein